MAFQCEVHAGYGAVPRDGESVSAGDILGLTADGKTVLQAPIAGRVRIERANGDGGGFIVHILPTDESEKEAGASPAS
jgi:hypothetical protein